MKSLRKWNVLMLIMAMILSLLAVPGTVQAAGKKNASDVAAINAIIKKQRAAGAKVPTNLNSDCYSWNSKGRLVGIYWAQGKSDDIVGDIKLKGSISFAKLPALDTLYVTGAGLTAIDVKGNKNLKYLSCYNTALTKLDVSKNTKLVSLDCSDNKLTKLDVSKNTKLVQLHCYGNKLTKLDLSKNTKLKAVYCYSNKLTKLKLGKNTKLEELSCEENKLTKLDVSKCTKLSSLTCNNNKLTKLDVSKNTKLDNLHCKKNKIKVIDASNCAKDIDIECDKSVTVFKPDGDAAALKKLIKKQKAAGAKVPENITNKCYTWSKSGDLTGINWSGLGLTGSISFSELSGLESIDVSGNQLTAINVESNRKLITLNCSSNQLAELNVESNRELVTLNCSSNQLTRLIVTRNTELVTLDCSSNQITALNLRNNTKLVNLNCDATVNILR